MEQSPQPQIHEQETEESGDITRERKPLAASAEAGLEDKLVNLLLKIEDQKTGGKPEDETKIALGELGALTMELTGQSLEELRLRAFERLVLERLGPKPFVSYLAGLTSPRAWEIREDALANNRYASLSHSLAGIDTERAWEMRELIKNNTAPLETYVEIMANSLAGVDSARAWAMRRSLPKKGVNINFLVNTLAGLDSTEAWEFREEMLALGANEGSMSEGLAGIDSPKASEMRKRFEGKANLGCVVDGVTGLDTDEAWKIRDDLVARDIQMEYVTASLAGLDTDRAWDLRRKIADRGFDLKYTAKGLAGLLSERADKMREELKERQLDVRYIEQSLNGGAVTAAAWRAAKGLLPHQIEQNN